MATRSLCLSRSCCRFLSRSDSGLRVGGRVGRRVGRRVAGGAGGDGEGSRAAPVEVDAVASGSTRVGVAVFRVWTWVDVPITVDTMVIGGKVLVITLVLVTTELP